MYKFVNILCLTFVLSVSIFAQTNTDEYKKNEFYVGYSNQQVDTGNYSTLNGFEGSYVRNVHRYFGIKGDVSGTYKNRKNSFTTNNNTISFEQNRAVYNFLGGVQIKDNSSDAKVKPFAHVLAGVGNVRNKTKNYACTGPNCPTFVNLNGTFSETGFASAVGGGLDIKINDKIDFRAIQVDYNPIRNGGSTMDNVRFGIGVVFK